LKTCCEKNEKENIDEAVKSRRCHPVRRRVSMTKPANFYFLRLHQVYFYENEKNKKLGGALSFTSG